MISDTTVRCSEALLPRGALPSRLEVERALPPGEAAAEYQRTVSRAVEDFTHDGDEVDELHRRVLELGLSAHQVADAHRAFLVERLVQYLDDDELSWEEYEQLRVLSRLLAVDGRWLEELVADVRPRHVAATLDGAADELPEDDECDGALEAPLGMCFTGPFEAMPLTRQDVEALATDAGMLVRPGVSAKLDLLVCRDPYAGTSKLRRAEQHGTVVIDQEAFLAIAGAATPPRSPVATVLQQVAARRRARAQPTSGPRKARAAGPNPPEPVAMLSRCSHWATRCCGVRPALTSGVGQRSAGDHPSIAPSTAPLDSRDLSRRQPQVVGRAAAIALRETRRGATPDETLARHPMAASRDFNPDADFHPEGAGRRIPQCQWSRARRRTALVSLWRCDRQG